MSYHSTLAQSHLTLLHSQRYWPINPAMSLSVVTAGSLVTPAAQWTGDRTCHYSSLTQQNTCVQYRCPLVTSHHITSHHTTHTSHPGHTVSLTAIATCQTSSHDVLILKKLLHKTHCLQTHTTGAALHNQCRETHRLL